MNFTDLEKNWNGLGENDPYWAVLTDPNKQNNQWSSEEFYETGRNFFNFILKDLAIEDKVGKQKALDFGCGPGRITQAMCCLLYTSPSPRDATLSRMPSSA